MEESGRAALLIVGAGGTGRELRELVAMTPGLRFAGFLDDRQQGPEVMGKLADHARHPHALLAALGSYKSMASRRRVLEQLGTAKFTRFVDQRALIYPSAAVSDTAVVFPFTAVTAGVVVGRHVLLYHSVTVAHDSVVGDYVIVANGATISGHVSIGENTYVGAGVTTREGISIGAGCIIAAGATVYTDVPPNSLYLSRRDIRPNPY